MRVRNPLDRAVSGVFPPYGVINIEPGDAAEIPDAVWSVWQDANMWGGRPCPLVQDHGEVGAVAEAAPPPSEERRAGERPAAKRGRKR